MKYKSIISLFCTTALAVSSTTAFAAEIDMSKDVGETYTYYFLAPDDWFNKDKGAVNEDIGVFFWGYDDSGKGITSSNYPGEKMTPAPWIGKNVFEIEGVDSRYVGCVFNSFTEISPDDSTTNQNVTVSIDLSGYEEGDCLYDSKLTTGNFNGWIYVLDLDFVPYTAIIPPRPGQWFTLDNYKNNEDYYGAYNIEELPYDPSTSVYGDMDNDRTITANDALIILRASVGLNHMASAQIALADVDCDSSITAADALAVLRYSVGFDENDMIGTQYSI